MLLLRPKQEASARHGDEEFDHPLAFSIVNSFQARQKTVNKATANLRGTVDVRKLTIPRGAQQCSLDDSIGESLEIVR